MSLFPSKTWLPLIMTGLIAGSLAYLNSAKVVEQNHLSLPLVEPTLFAIATTQPVVKNEDFKHDSLPFLSKYCLRCHTGDDPQAGFDLSKFNSQAAVDADLKSWKMIIEAVDSQYMPPSDEAQPDAMQIQRLKNWYLKTLSKTGQHTSVVPQMRRLNRTEYQNTVDDLLQIHGDLFADASRILLVDDYFQPAKHKMPRYVLAISHFSYIEKQPALLAGLPAVPNDPPVEHGFSNDYTSLSFSTLQTERYLELANTILYAKMLPRMSGLWKTLFLPRKMDTDPAQQKATAKSRLRAFLGRAFRRPAKESEVVRYSKLFNAQLDRLGSHADAMRATVSAILVSPSFLFRQDFSAGSFDKKSVDPYAMASRLSYFLWASMPDDELFQAAKEGRLNQPTELTEEVRRMMRDKRIKSLATDFGLQWLKLASVNSTRPDRDLFPEFYRPKNHTPAESMKIEQLLFFETVMIEDRNIMEFVDADWGYVNRRLMDWYGLNPSDVLGFTPDRPNFEDFFRVKWLDPNKGGVITSGATLISTSATTRTSPVYRGAWILDVIFNQPPPPPPADVPPLESAGKHAGHPLNVREKLERHRDDPTCALCHDKMDPIGFALEEFDAVGRFRQEYKNGTAIDAKGAVFGEEFDGAAGLKAVISNHERKFIQGFTEHMLKYALGRRLELTDEKEVEQIVDAVIRRGKNFSAVVEEIILSDLFRSPPTQKSN